MTAQETIASAVVGKEYATESLSREWAAEEPEKAKGPDGQFINFVYGCKNFTKMIQFAKRVNLTNEQIAFWVGRGPAREEGELFEEYKLRMKFQKALIKYRGYVPVPRPLKNK